MSDFFAPANFAKTGAGPLYLQLHRRILDGISGGQLGYGSSLPPERDLAQVAGLSRVTVRKAIQSLVVAGALVQRRGSGTYVAPRVVKLEQALSQLTSFTDDMARRGKASESIWICRGLFLPAPEEVMALGLGSDDRVARLERVRSSGGQPLAIERAALSGAVLPDPESVSTSLYALLQQRGLRPVRAVQRISAANLGRQDAELLGVNQGAAGLKIERISYLPSGRVVEFTRSVYRGDAYDFAVELKVSHDGERNGN